MILEVVQSKWSLTWYDPLGPRMCVLELLNGHVLQTLREQLKVPGSRLEGSELLTSEFLRFRSRLNETSGGLGKIGAVSRSDCRILKFLRTAFHKNQKLFKLTERDPNSNSKPLEQRYNVVTIPKDLPLSEPEKSILGKGLNFVPLTKKTDEFTVKEDTEKFLRRVKLKAHFHDKEKPSDEPQRDEFESLKPRKSNWTPLDGQFTSVDLFVKKCRVDIQKLNFNKNLKFSNLSKEEWTAHQNLKTRDDIVIKPADKGGAVVIWHTDLYKQEAFRQLADTKFYAKVYKDLTQANQRRH